jgi:hypothetical protein
MVAFPLLSRAPLVLVGMSIFWCGAIVGMLILHSTDATEPATPAPAQTQTIRVVAVRSAFPVEETRSPSSVTFDDRWAAHDEERAPPLAAKDARAQVLPPPPSVAPEIHVAQNDPVCGARGRRYFYLGRHKYWRCRR